jgi:hypothetical protein
VLCRLDLRPGCDVRCPAALLTYKQWNISDTTHMFFRLLCRLDLRPGCDVRCLARSATVIHPDAWLLFGLLRCAGWTYDPDVTCDALLPFSPKSRGYKGRNICCFACCAGWTCGPAVMCAALLRC